MRRDQRTSFGWRLWEYQWTPARAAYYTVLARARDAAGNVQPLEQEWNPSGYAWNVVPRANVNVISAASTASPQRSSTLPALEPPSSFKGCLACHDEDVIVQQRLTRAQWDGEITKMTGWGAKVSDADRSAILDYLAGRYGPRRP